MSTPIVAEPPAQPPTPNDMPQAAPEPAEEPAKARTPEEYEAEIAKLRRSEAGYRTRARDSETKAKAYDEWQESQKSEIQRETDARTAAETELATTRAEIARLRVAAKYGIPEEDHDLLGSGTPEELDARGARLAALRQSSTPPPPPPTDRPVEGLRPGASPNPPAAPDNSYPAAWKP